ncbi:hypothetical protein VdG2_00226 [Verticillium dahliae VDG2]|nr:hypothetical protein VdG2_00226 [Verticillium dahliae VDG2]
MVGYWGGGTLLLGQSVSPLPPSARNDKDRILPEVEPGAHSNTTNTTAQGALSSDYFVDLASGGSPEDGPPGTKFDRYPSAFPIDIFPSPRTDNPGSGSDKKTRLRARNRAAADMYRARKQRGIEDLQAQEAALSAINESLRDKYVKLRGEVLMLRDMVLQHRRCRCSFIEKYNANITKANHDSSSRTAISPAGVVGDRVDKTVRPIGGYFGIVYRSKYQSSEHTILWHTALIYVANAVLQDTRDPEWHFYFLQCVSGYESLRKSYRLAEVVGRALLSMTLRNGDISGTEARELLQRLKQKGLDNDTSDRIRATFMGDLELAMTNPRQASVENLAEQFEDMALWQEFTNTEGV